MPKLLTATEAAGLLNIKPATLYAYVSRGLLTPVKNTGERGSRFKADEVSRLRKQRSYGHAPKKAVGEALHLGLPVLESNLSLIEEGCLYYRGKSITELARTHTLEDVAQLLWACEAVNPFAAGVSGLKTRRGRIAAGGECTLSVVSRCIETLSINRIDEHESVWYASAAVVRLVASAVLQSKPSTEHIDGQCARAWQLNKAQQQAIRAALVVSADHELNVSSFTARCVASCGASLNAAVIAGLAALGGIRHGAYSERVETIWDEIEASASIAKGVRAIVARGAPVPGFSHPLYPGGDPRCTVLFGVWTPHATAKSIAKEVLAQTGELPTIDFALVALRRGLKLPRGIAAKIFTIARTVGWIAHALEQRADARLIRPRSRYVGARPEPSRIAAARAGRLVTFSR